MISSLMNSNISITQDSWAVTLTCDKHKSLTTKTFHTRIFFEGLRDKNDLSSYFYRIAHLKALCTAGPSSIGIVDLQNEKNIREQFQVTFRAKTETWKVSRVKIEALIKELAKEHSKETPFHICGAKSLFAKKAEIFEIYDELLGKVYQENAALFLRLYDSAQNGGECTGMSQIEFDQAIAKVQTSINSPLATQLTYQFLITRVRDFVEKLDTSQNNCLTWAREQLGKLGIKLKDNQLESIISITTLYAKYKPEENIPLCKTCIDSKAEENIPNIDSKAEENIPKKWEDRQMYERFVTYDVNRDCRTEEWKPIEKQSRINKNVAKASVIVQFTGFTLTHVATIGGIAACVLGAPVVVIPAVTVYTVGFTGFLAGTLIHGIMKDKQNKLIQDSLKNTNLHQHGNDLEKLTPVTRELPPFSFIKDPKSY
jgi:hypothetical protein